jgi:Uma2 family endonuclease
MTAQLRDNSGFTGVFVPKLTYDDYAQMTPPDSHNYELHNGKIITIPTPIPLHQTISAELHIALGYYVKTHKLGKVIAAPMDTKLTEHDTVQPDLLFIDQNRLEIIGKTKIEGAPDFIVEIHSKGNSAKEMAYKKGLYESCGVREYWVIYPKKKELIQFENRGNQFVELGKFKGQQAVNALVVNGFSLKVADLFD